MSITAYKIESVGHDRTGKDYGYVNKMCIRDRLRVVLIPEVHPLSEGHFELNLV